MVNSELQRIGQWLFANKLSLNVAKTEFLLVWFRYKYAQLTFPLKIKKIIRDDPIQKIKASKSLGIYIDEKLSWSSHTDHLVKKISSNLAGLKQAPIYGNSARYL